MLDRLTGIDIIIPIYNALEDLTACINSIVACSDLTINRLLLINDCSSDNRVLPYLENLKKEYDLKSIIVINNSTNLGFSGSVNNGITYSYDRDVLLLNSDTIVTAGWLEKIVLCANSDETIATVTPLSNNATICSVPELFVENTIPQGFSVEAYAKLIEECSLKKYPRIPVANGFCMYIKRCVIQKIGVFDFKAFGKGYGEENDFCHRAEQAGYCHAMCDDTFIYHKGTSSFVSAEKRKCISDHEKILSQRYPMQVFKLQEFLNARPTRIINDNIKFYQTFTNGRTNILYLVQADFRADADDNIGGTQLHVKDLVSALKTQFNIFVVARNLNYLNVTGYLGESQVYAQYYIGNEPAYPQFRSSMMGKIYGDILDAYHINIVHVHHTKGLTLEIYYQAHARNIPIIDTLHDYYFACPSIKLLDNNNELCINKENEKKCKECLHAQKGISEEINYISLWREYSREIFRLVDNFITPSEASKQIICKYFPEIANRTLVIEHGNTEFTSFEKKPHELSLPSLNIAFVGGLSPEKGCNLASEMIKHSSDNINWYVFGMMGYNSLNLLQKKNLTKTGSYQREDLPKLYTQYKIDVVCILSVWPETYCYTLSETLQCKIPVIVTDIGALGARVKELKCGWVVPVDATSEAILSLIADIVATPSEYQEKIRNIYNLSLKTIDTMGKDYAAIYKNIAAKNNKILYKVYDKKYILNGYLVANRLIDDCGDENIYKRVEDAENELLNIHRSIAYKLGLIICKVKIPFKKQLKAFAFECYKKMQQK